MCGFSPLSSWCGWLRSLSAKASPSLSAFMSQRHRVARALLLRKRARSILSAALLFAATVGLQSPCCAAECGGALPVGLPAAVWFSWVEGILEPTCDCDSEADWPQNAHYVGWENRGGVAYITRAVQPQSMIQVVIDYVDQTFCKPECNPEGRETLDVSWHYLVTTPGCWQELAGPMIEVTYPVTSDPSLPQVIYNDMDQAFASWSAVHLNATSNEQMLAWASVMGDNELGWSLNGCLQAYATISAYQWCESHTIEIAPNVSLEIGGNDFACVCTVRFDPNKKGSDKDQDNNGKDDGQDCYSDLDVNGTLDCLDDWDGDGKPNGEDDDWNGDGVGDQGSSADSDGDGFRNNDDGDMDGDGIPNSKDENADGDSMEDSLDPDDDNDGTPDGQDDTPRGCVPSAIEGCYGCGTDKMAACPRDDEGGDDGGGGVGGNDSCAVPASEAWRESIPQIRAAWCQAHGFNKVQEWENTGCLRFGWILSPGKDAWVAWGSVKSAGTEPLEQSAMSGRKKTGLHTGAQGRPTIDDLIAVTDDGYQVQDLASGIKFRGRRSQLPPYPTSGSIFVLSEEGDGTGPSEDGGTSVGSISGTVFAYLDTATSSPFQNYKPRSPGAGVMMTSVTSLLGGSTTVSATLQGYMDKVSSGWARGIIRGQSCYSDASQWMVGFGVGAARVEMDARSAFPFREENGRSNLPLPYRNYFIALWSGALIFFLSARIYSLFGLGAG